MNCRDDSLEESESASDDLKGEVISGLGYRIIVALQSYTK